MGSSRLRWCDGTRRIWCELRNSIDERSFAIEAESVAEYVLASEGVTAPETLDSAVDSRRDDATDGPSLGVGVHPGVESWRFEAASESEPRWVGSALMPSELWDDGVWVDGAGDASAEPAGLEGPSVGPPTPPSGLEFAGDSVGDSVRCVEAMAGLAAGAPRAGPAAVAMAVQCA